METEWRNKTCSPKGVRGSSRSDNSLEKREERGMKKEKNKFKNAAPN
jgi:hypothetical protein